MSRLGLRLRETIAHAHSQDGERGQVIVLFALSLVALLLIGALVLDVARVYAVQRYQRSVADAAALAGAQDLQDVTSSGPQRPVSPADYPRAQCDAYNLLVRELGGSQSPLDCSATSISFPSSRPPYVWSTTNTTYTPPGPIAGHTVAITTPYPPASYGDRAVKVTISQPGFALTFGNLVCLVPGSGCSAGAPVWNPTVASVAESYPKAQYALMTLQPGGNLCSGGGNPIDLSVSGSGTDGTILTIGRGDVGTNTTACTSPNTGSKPSQIKLVQGYYIDTYQALPTTLSQYWYQDPATGLPQGHKISSLIKDPNYSFPQAYAATFASQSGGVDGSCSTTATGSSYLPTSLVDATPGVTWTCYKPGTYSAAFSVTGGGAGGIGAYLEPGAYYFNSGLNVGSGNFLAGGVVSGDPGVVLVFPESAPSHDFSTGSSGSTVLLNVGDVKLDPSTGSVLPVGTSYATAASDANSNVIDTPQGWVLTVMVRPDPTCFNADHTPVVPPCSTSGNQVIKLAGNPNLQMAGVLYGPSDNMQITSNGTSQIGGDGQIVSYTISYGGGADLSQVYPGGPENNVLRIATVCSPGAPCP